MIDEDEEWGRVRMGRFSDADEKLVRRIMGPWFLRRTKAFGASRLSVAGKPQRRSQRNSQAVGLSGRASVVSWGYSYKASRQAIVKVGYCPKSARMAQKQLCYIFRLRESDRESGEYGTIPAWDGFGRPIPLDEVLNIVKTWDLMSDEVNYSKKARALVVQGDSKALHELSGRQRLHNLQTWHFMFSIEDDAADDAVVEKLRGAMRATLDESFTARGHKVAWAIHQGHTSHLHAHVVVKAPSEFGGRFHSDNRGHYLYRLRETFARYLRYTGLEYEATRRVDRTPLREQIMAGYEPLHDDRPRWRQCKGRDPYAGLHDWSSVFGDQALEGLQQLADARAKVMEAVKATNGKERIAVAAQILRDSLEPITEKPSWLRRQIDKALRPQEKEKWPLHYGELYDVFNSMYHDPEPALASWQWMVMDGASRDEQGKINYPNRALASWNLRRRPELFGRVKAEALSSFDDKWLKKLLWCAWMPDPEWMPRASSNDNFFENRILSQIHKDRKKVVTEMEHLITDIETGDTH